MNPYETHDPRPGDPEWVEYMLDNDLLDPCDDCIVTDDEATICQGCIDAYVQGEWEDAYASGVMGAWNPMGNPIGAY